MDSTIDDTTPDDSAADNDDLWVQLDTLAIDGTRPRVGDKVDLKVSGTISKIVNDAASVTPEMVNDQPIPQDQETTPEDEMNALAVASKGVPIGGGGY